MWGLPRASDSVQLSPRPRQAGYRDRMADGPAPDCYATISQGVVLLWRKGWNSPSCRIGRDAASAIVYGDELVVNFLDGRTIIYRITASGASAYPVRTVK